MLDISVYKLVSHDSRYADLVINAACEQDARLLATSILTAADIASANSNHTLVKDQTDFYQHPSNASCFKLIEGIDFEPLLTYGDFISIAIGERAFHFRKAWTH